jgi:hypothetical protein
VFVVGCIFFGAHLGWQIERLDIDDPDLCLRCSSRTATPG